jgi:hypothetical protein
MASFNEYKRRAFLPLVTLGLGAYYLLVFVPLANQAERLDQPLKDAWRKLASSLDETNALSLDFLHITNQLAETRQALAILENTRKKTVMRLQLEPALRARMNSGFQLFEYQAERSKQMDELDRTAKQQQVAVDPAVFNGLPEYTIDVQEPPLLWAALAATEDMINLAIRCKVTGIASLEVPLNFTNTASAEMSRRWAEIPIHFEFTGPALNAARFLSTLPLRANELKTAGLPEASAGKFPLFIDRLIVKKQPPEKVDEVHVWVRALAFVLRE